MKLSSILSTAPLLIIILLPGFSCQRTDSKKLEDEVYYYPAKNVYYDTRQSRYYYSLNAAVSWDSMSYKGAGIGKALGPKITIGRIGENIWLNNEQDRKTHNGVLLNTVNSLTISITKTDSVSKLKPVIPAGKKTMVDKVDINEAPPKKGLKKFFNNLFGKKKKPAKDIKQ